MIIQNGARIGQDGFGYAPGPRGMLKIVQIGRVIIQDNVEIGAAWVRTGQVSGELYVSLSLAAPEFGPCRLYANLGRAAGQDDDDTYALIWNPAD